MSDIDLAAKVLDTEFYRGELQPIALPVQSLKSILVLAPHQDDETIGCGGALLKAAKAGAKIDVLYITDGATEWRSDEWTQRRDAEAETVCRQFGATVHRLGLYNPRPEPTLRDIKEFARIIGELQPQIILAPWLLDSPGKHRLVNHLLWLAHRAHGLPPCEVWGYQVHNTLLPNGYVDITDVIEQKRALLECYQTQNEHGACYVHLAMGLAAWNAHYVRSVRPQFIEVFTTLPLHEMLTLVESFYFTDMKATYRGESGVWRGAAAIHKLVVEALDPVVQCRAEPLFTRPQTEPQNALLTKSS